MLMMVWLVEGNSHTQLLEVVNWCHPFQRAFWQSVVGNYKFHFQK